ncbi:hypothetical protein QZH41_020195, partial [Actinostola sp. cb2023]
VDFDKYTALSMADDLVASAKELKHDKAPFLAAAAQALRDRIEKPIDQFQAYFLALFSDKDYTKVLDAITKVDKALKVKPPATSHPSASNQTGLAEGKGQRLRCYFCGAPGHTAPFCFKKRNQSYRGRYSPYPQGNPAFRLLEKKREKFVALTELILSSTHTDVKTLQRFAGKCVAFSLAVPGARLFVNEVHMAISRGSRSSRPIRVDGPPSSPAPFLSAVRCPTCPYANDHTFRFCQKCGYARKKRTHCISPLASLDVKALDLRIASLQQAASSSVYSKQKQSLAEELEVFLYSLPGHKSLASAAPIDICRFLVYKDFKGKTK